MKDNKRIGVRVAGVKTPIIQPKDDLLEIVISSVEEAIGKENISHGDIIGITEAVVAIAQQNFVTLEDIATDVKQKFEGAKKIAIVDPIQSRNRFMEILKAISKIPELEHLYIVMTYPTDEVGNRLISDEMLIENEVNPYKDLLTLNDFYSKFGVPKHPFTGMNYLEEYRKACEGKEVDVILCNDFSRVAKMCDSILVCSIHRRKTVKKILLNKGAKRVLDLSEIMDEPIKGSGYNKEFGLYGSNLMAGGRLKLMPRDSQEFAESVRDEMSKRYGKNVEAFVFGDGAFKDPVGGIWELADPTTTPGATAGLKGTPKEVKLKYIASANEGCSSRQLEEIVAEEKRKRLSTADVTKEESLGTTPRRITDLVASIADLTTGSGDRQTPVVYIKGYLN